MTAATVDRRRSLDARPVPNPGLTVRRRQDGLLTLVAPKKLRRRPRWQKTVFLTPPERELEVDLDAAGSFVWDLCDGEHSVREMILALAERYLFARREAEVSVLSYLKTLGQRGFIAMRMDEHHE